MERFLVRSKPPTTSAETAESDNPPKEKRKKTLRSRQPHFGKAPSSQSPLNICCASITALTVRRPTRPKWMGKQFFIPGATVKHEGNYRFADIFNGFLFTVILTITIVFVTSYLALVNNYKLNR